MQVWLVHSVVGDRRAGRDGCSLFDGLVNAIAVAAIGFVLRSDFLHYRPKPINGTRQEAHIGR